MYLSTYLSIYAISIHLLKSHDITNFFACDFYMPKFDLTFLYVHKLHCREWKCTIFVHYCFFTLPYWPIKWRNWAMVDNNKNIQKLCIYFKIKYYFLYFLCIMIITYLTILHTYIYIYLSIYNLSNYYLCIYDLSSNLS